MIAMKSLNPMLNQQPVWQDLKKHQQAFSSTTLQTLFRKDANRFERFSLEAAGILLDYSKNYITTETIDYLIKLAKDLSLASKIETLFQEENYTLFRQLDHAQTNSEVNLAIQNAKAQMKRMVHQIRNHTWTGFSGKPITDIVNIGIGGSDLGPRMVIDALRHYKNSKLRYHFISNADGSDLSELLPQLPPESTLFILASKSFKTPETLCHANTIKPWLLEAAQGNQEVLEKQLLAVTAYPEKAIALGVSHDHILPLWSWVSGRFSLWSSIGLPIALAIGMEEFENLLKGACAMDQHFRKQPLHQNMPIILALLSIWYINIWGIQTQAIIPYTQLLRYFPTYLQQLEMESNGKSVNKAGDPLDYSTAPSILGGVGTDAQHSFFQWLHQGTQWVPVDFIAVINSHHDLKSHHQLLLASCFAQSQVLTQGSQLSESSEPLSPHQKIKGGRPSNIILMPELSPYTLGAFIALYEHKTVVEGLLWDINSFDQWGVELGKQSTETLLKSIQCDSISSKQNASTSLLSYYHNHINNSCVLKKS